MPEVTIPKPRRASIAPEVSVQFAPWNGPPSNCVIGGMRGKPERVLVDRGLGAEERVRGRGEVGRGEGRRAGPASPDGRASNATGSGDPPGVSGAPASR